MYLEEELVTGNLKEIEDTQSVKFSLKNYDSMIWLFIIPSSAKITFDINPSSQMASQNSVILSNNLLAAPEPGVLYMDATFPF